MVWAPVQDWVLAKGLEQVQALARERALVAWAPESVQVQVWGLALAGVPGQERAQVSGPAQAPPRELE